MSGHRNVNRTIPALRGTGTVFDTLVAQVLLYHDNVHVAMSLNAVVESKTEGEETPDDN